MDCQKIKEYIYSFLDGELDDKTSLLVKEHLSICPLCKLALEQERKADSLIRHNITKEKAPFELKETILSRIRGPRTQKISIFALHILRPILIGACGTVLILILFSLLNKPFPVFNEALKEHIQFLKGNLSLEIQSQSPSEVHSWLQAKLDFKVMTPDLSSQGVRLQGARLCNLKSKKTAYIMYNKGEHSLSVFMFDAKSLRFPTTKKVVVNDKMFRLYKEKGYNSVLWVDEGIACVFVSDLDEAELLHLANL